MLGTPWGAVWCPLAQHPLRLALMLQGDLPPPVLLGVTRLTELCPGSGDISMIIVKWTIGIQFHHFMPGKRPQPLAETFKQVIFGITHGKPA